MYWTGLGSYVTNLLTRLLWLDGQYMLSRACLDCFVKNIWYVFLTLLPERHDEYLPTCWKHCCSAPVVMGSLVMEKVYHENCLSRKYFLAPVVMGCFVKNAYHGKSLSRLWPPAIVEIVHVEYLLKHSLNGMASYVAFESSHKCRCHFPSSECCWQADGCIIPAKMRMRKKSCVFVWSCFVCYSWTKSPCCWQGYYWMYRQRRHLICVNEFLEVSRIWKTMWRP
jgi:hypothetical protein